jgi:L-threonylcarbamoyladenylate synthase
VLKNKKLLSCVLFFVFLNQELPARMNEDIKKAIEVLNRGGLILYPTDTVWGIGCDATNEAAVQKVFELKQRADSKALLVLIDNPMRLEVYLRTVPEIAWELIDVADKPLTIIYDEAKNLAANLLSEDGSVGIRVTREAFSQKLCERFRRPIVSTSANVSGQPTPSCFSEIDPLIVQGVDYVVEYRQDDQTKSKPSSIIRLGNGGQIQVIR